MKKLIDLFNSETPAIAKFLQGVFTTVAVGVTAIFLFWGGIPEEFKDAVSPKVMQSVVYVGCISALGTALLQFFKKKSK